jgi:hypothetical protein
MLITRKSMLSGKVNTLEIPVTQEQLDLWESGAKLIQHVMPELTDSHREFIMTGITDDEWDKTFKEDEE